MKDVYILLMRSNSYFSRMIKVLTRAKYTHTSIGLDSDCQSLYSFARIYPSLPLPAGFIRENICEGVMAKNGKEPCALFKINVDDDVYSNIASTLESYEKRNDVKRIKYNLLGTLYCFFGVESKKKDKYFCSHFVAEVLEVSGALTLKKPASLYQPMDFARHNELQLIYEGTLSELTQKTMVPS